MGQAQKVWTKSHNELAAQVAEVGTILTFEDGTQGVMPGTVPAGLAAAFARSTSVGYAKGWL
jgi:hypothetical protein